MSILTQSKNTFEGKLPDEETILLTRKHWLNLFFPLATIKLSVILIFGSYFIINSFGWYEKLSSLYWFIVLVFLLVFWTLAFYSIMIYELNTVIVTNKRIIENKQGGLFKHTVNELELDKIQDISVQVVGPLAEFLRFGDIEIQSAGAKNKFTFYQLPRPTEIKNKIVRIKAKQE